MRFRPDRVMLLGLWLALPFTGCAQFDTGHSARWRLARALGCEEEQVEMEQIGAYRYRGEGCGSIATVACTSSALEPRCEIERAARSTSGDEAPAEVDAEAVASNDAPESAAPEQTDPVPVTPQPRPASSSTPAPAPAGIESMIRDGLDARRDDVLACVSRDRVAVRAAYAADGTVTLSLSGELAGSAEEGCVRAALDGVRVAATDAGGVIIHLVR
ncbi:MAG: hypothetical protein AB7P00_34115 [Sandaracinaceae bacterium]